MSVVQYETPAPLPASRPGDELEPGPVGWVARLRGAAEYAAYIANTEFVPSDLKGRPEAIAAAILYGDELGLSPLQSLAKIAVIKGKPSLTAEAQRSLVLSAGHELWFDESTVTRAIAAGRRHGEERVGRITWTLDDAKRAGLAGGPAWRAYPAEMLRARASAALARAMFADVIGGLPAVEELEGLPDNGDVPPPAELPSSPTPPEAGEPDKPKRTRKRATTTKAAEPAPEPEPSRPAVPPTPPPDEQPEPELPDGDPPATDAYKRRIFATMRDLEFADRDERLRYTSTVIGRTVESSNELTIGEASTLIDQLEKDLAARAAGETAFVDELKRTFDATETAAEPEPEQPPEAPESAPKGDPVPYNEFPPGF